MKKELIYLKTNKEGEVSIMAYKFAEGLYIHKLYQGGGKFTDRNYWTITHKSGFCVKAFAHIPMKLKDVALEAGKLIHLDWDLPYDFLMRMNPGDAQKFKEAIMSLHG